MLYGLATFGIVSGTWRGIVDRHEEMVANPNLYNIVNAFTGGFLDTLKGAVTPEEPWSLEHWLDILGTVLTVYAAYQTAVNVKNILTGGGDDALSTDGALADDVDDIVRSAELTRAQIDDIIKMPRRQRPDPSIYLTKEYIDHHLSQFKDGVTKFYAKAPTGTVGPREETFIFPLSHADDMITQATGDIRVLGSYRALTREV